MTSLWLILAVLVWLGLGWVGSFVVGERLWQKVFNEPVPQKLGWIMVLAGPFNLVGAWINTLICALLKTSPTT